MRGNLKLTLFTVVLAWIIVFTSAAIIMHYVGLWRGMVLSPPLWMIDIAQQLIWAVIVGTLAPSIKGLEKYLPKPKDKN